MFRVLGVAYWLNRMVGFIACLWLASFLFLYFIYGLLL